MNGLSELRNNLESILTEYSLKRQQIQKKTEMGNRLAHNIRSDLPDFGDMLQKMALVELKPLIDRDLPKLDDILSGLAKDESDDSVKIIFRVFSSECDEYRKSALRTLGSMKNPKANKAISRRASWLSTAPKSEKEFARSLLKGS